MWQDELHCPLDDPELKLDSSFEFTIFPGPSKDVLLPLTHCPCPLFEELPSAPATLAAFGSDAFGSDAFASEALAFKLSAFLSSPEAESTAVFLGGAAFFSVSAPFIFEPSQASTAKISIDNMAILFEILRFKVNLLTQTFYAALIGPSLANFI